MDTNPNPEPNKELENAAAALNEAAVETEASAEEPKTEEKPIDEATSAEMDKLINEEPAPEAPATPEVAPAPETPAEATPVIEAPAPEAAPAPETPAEKAPEAKKKSKKGLIIGCTIGAVAALGIGGFAFAYTMSNTEENIALSAISDLFNNHAKTISGYVEVTPIEDEDDEDGDIQTNSTVLKNCVDDETGMTNKCGGGIVARKKNPISRVRVDIENNTNADNENKTSATFLVTYNDKDFKITVDSVVVKDYTLYVSISNLKETIKNALTEVSKDSSMSSYSDYIELYEDLIDKVVGEVDGVWWKISIPDLIDSNDSINASDKAKVKEAYSCVVDVANKASKDNGKFADIYKENAFVSIKKYTGSAKPSASGDLYTVNLDANKFANFANAMTDQIDSYGLEDCIKKLDGVQGVNASYTKERVEASQFEDAFKEYNGNLIVAIDNGFFSHKLSGIYMAKENESFRGVIDFKVENLKGTISAPSDAKNISDLVKNVTKAYEEWEETATCKYYKKNYPSMYNVYCDTTTDKPLSQYKSSSSTSLMV